MRIDREVLSSFDFIITTRMMQSVDDSECVCVCEAERESENEHERSCGLELHRSHHNNKYR